MATLQNTNTGFSLSNNFFKKIAPYLHKSMVHKHREIRPTCMTLPCCFASILMHGALKVLSELISYFK